MNPIKWPPRWLATWAWGLLGLMLPMTLVYAQGKPTLLVPLAEANQASGRSVNEWLLRMHEASRQRAYVGTFVVTAGGNLSSARIWHICDGSQQMERVESLTGAPRTTVRRNDTVMTFLPERREVVSEKRDSLGLFPNLLHSNQASLAQFYRVKVAGSDRIAGVAADVVNLLPADTLRFGYRVWTEKKTGLVVKLQTLDGAGQVLEQSAFSELQLDAPVSMAQLSRLMDNPQGYQVVKPQIQKTTAAAEGWVLKSAVPGFAAMNCFKRPMGGPLESRHDDTLQWVFSDGLASVSLFIEAFDPRRHTQAGSAAQGATATLTRRMGDWWLTAVGEVPPQTLTIFAQGLELKK